MMVVMDGDIIRNMDAPEFDDWAICMTYWVASKSKDPRTHVGAIVFGPGREIRTTGYNSLPRGVDDSKTYRFEKGEKEVWVPHAEQNAIYNSTRTGVSLLGCTMYVCYFPCMPCAVALSQSGITEVVSDANWDNGDLNEEEIYERRRRVFELFGENGVVHRFHKTKYAPLERFNDGVRTRLA